MCLSSFLKTGTIQASLQSNGTCPVSSEVWNIIASIGASSSAAALRINAGIEFGRFQSVEKFLNSFQLTSMMYMLGYGLVPLSGRELVSSFVKTDTNWSLRMLALLVLSLLRKPSYF